MSEGGTASFRYADPVAGWSELPATGEEYPDRLLATYKVVAAQMRGITISTHMVELGAPAVEILSEAASDLHEETNDADLSVVAGRIASGDSYVPSRAPEVPTVGGNLVADVAAVCGLTNGDLARLFGVSERAVAAWRATEPPAPRIELLQALRSIGLILVAGLGAHGVKVWFVSGEPNRLERIQRGELRSVVEEARSYLDSIAS